MAGVTVGQDLSERFLHAAGRPRSTPSPSRTHGFAPTGPVLVTPDEFDDPDDLALGCEVNGHPMQAARTSLMIFPVAELVAYLSTVVTLLPGDVIFTGTPEGVGMGRTPPVFLGSGDRCGAGSRASVSSVSGSWRGSGTAKSPLCSGGRSAHIETGTEGFPVPPGGPVPGRLQSAGLVRVSGRPGWRVEPLAVVGEFQSISPFSSSWVAWSPVMVTWSRRPR